MGSNKMKTSLWKTKNRDEKIKERSQSTTDLPKTRSQNSVTAIENVDKTLNDEEPPAPTIASSTSQRELVRQSEEQEQSRENEPKR